MNGSPRGSGAGPRPVTAPTAAGVGAEGDGALWPVEAVGGRGQAEPSTAGRRRAAAKGAFVPARERPIARVLVDTPLPHLDRPFDYLVPAALAAGAVPGCRVRVRFAGRPADGFLLERADTTGHEGRLAALERVISPEPVLTPQIAALCRAVADRYAGTMSDVVRLAVPPRHAKVEAGPEGESPRAAPSPARHMAVDPAPLTPPGAGPESDPLPGMWREYPAGPSFLAALTARRAPRAVWTVLPGIGEGAGPVWPEGIALAVLAAVRGGAGALVVAPDGKDVTLLDAALRRVLGEGEHVALTAGLGPAERYRRWLSVLRGQVRVVAGTRAAAFAPIHDLGLVVIWDDGDDLHAERLAPYPHTREVLALRAHQTGAAMLIAGHARTAEATRLVATGWARPIGAARETVRRHAPKVRPTGDDAELARDQAARAARLPSLAWSALRHGLRTGPVLIQVPRRGYLPALACQVCRAPARCIQYPPVVGDRATAGRRRPRQAPSRAPGTGPQRNGTGDPDSAGGDVPAPLCGGPLALRGGHTAPYCRWCGLIAGIWRCQVCGSDRIRAVVIGARRTAEELGRAFPAVPVRTSGRDGVLATVGPAPALVVATPGAEPVPEGGYAAAVLLDGWAMLGRPDLRAAEETLRRWMNAAALLRPGAELIVLADSGVPAVQALLRWDPVTHAERELAERAALGFPPAVRMATLTGPPAAVREMSADLRPPHGAQLLGPVPVQAPGRRVPGEGEDRLMVRVPSTAGGALARSLKGAAGVRSARKAPDLVRVCMDPIDLI